MNNFIFENRTIVVFGKGCVKEYLGCYLRKYGERVLLAYGSGSIKVNGIYQEVINELQKAGKQFVEFPGIVANLTYERVMEGARLANDNQVDLILGIGGGSVADCCKAIALAARSQGDVWADYWERPGVIETSPLPLGVIVTVAGTGSAMNGSAVLTHAGNKIRISRDYPQCNPDFALLDPVYTYSVPKAQLLSGGFDILSHIMEAYFSLPDEYNISDDISEALMRGVIRDLRSALANPRDYNARGNLLWASAIAENRLIRLGKRTDFACHRIEYQLEACTNCIHGQGLAVLHPVYYRHIYLYSLQKFRRFAVNVWGFDPVDQSDEQLAALGVGALAGFIKELGLPSRLRELGIDREQLKEIAASCSLSSGGYKKISQEEILEILEACY